MRKHSKSEKAQLAAALTQVCALQKQFGKTQADLETLVEGFSWVLAEHPMPVILDALRKYISTPGCNDIPAPSDLVKIIDPPKEPLSAAVYTGLKRRIADEGYYPSSDEKAFLRAFEAQEMAKAVGTPAYENQKRLEQAQILRGREMNIGTPDYYAKQERDRQTAAARMSIANQGEQP